MNQKHNRLQRKDLRKGVYLIPSLFTIGNIFCGFFAVINSIKGYRNLVDPELARSYFNAAALAVGIAYLLDGLDGRIARLTGATSEFGVELDSIADVISFGIAPAVLAFCWGYGNLANHEQLAWAVSFFFLVCGALRLARFNVLARAPRFETPGTSPKLDKKYFVGLPIPGAAGFTAAIIHFSPLPLIGPGNEARCWIMLTVVFFLSVLMVSTFKYATFKDFGPRSHHPFLVIPALAALVLSVVLYSEWMLLIISGIYATHGPVIRLWGLLGRGRRRQPAVDQDQPAS